MSSTSISDVAIITGDGTGAITGAKYSDNTGGDVKQYNLQMLLMVVKKYQVQ